ncbi:hypothetical protein PPERSA_10395 [Pseudocohnilembus persalinus]|uniref:Uncharacterized protein n=1 Tax=Pseudocohnilembus persalinus TaxID=266149 RepID=A0A0V0R243_PSEPJ|nr:hypothetical protein PPERSA_10395 [Pseudocohnilembus persalinus]|eukprot:KRX08591.1 hypothetical protein PPERSA_10395 [Pseudocohnilembus persalinus]
MMQEGNNAYNFNTPLGLQNNNNESHSPSTADTLLSPFNLSNPSTLSNKVKISYQADAPKNDCDQLSNYFQKINIQENQNKKNSIDFNFNFDENISDFNTDDYFHNDNETLSSSSSRKTTSENVEQIIQDSFFCSSNPLNFSKKNKKKSDRFIPNRTTSKLDIALTSAHEMDENYYFQKNDPDRLKGKDINENNQLSFADIYKSQILGNKIKIKNIDRQVETQIQNYLIKISRQIG